MMKSNRLLSTVLVLQVLTLAGQWLDGPRIATASAGGGTSRLGDTREVSDSGAQRQQIIDQLRQTNQKFDRVISILESGKLQVQAQRSDDSKEGRSK